MSTRTVKVGTCRHCAAKILSGLDADRCAVTVDLEHDPTDELGEYLAVLTGRDTYDLRPALGRSHGRQMEIRRPHRMELPRHHPVHAVHVCRQPLPVAPPTPKTFDVGSF